MNSEIRLQIFSFDNFFYSSDPGSQQNVNAVGAEYRTDWRFSDAPTIAYANVNLLGYSKSGLDRAYGGRLGLSSDDKKQEYNVYADVSKNRPASDIRNAGTANRTTFFGEYGYSIAPAWQLAANATHQNEQIRTQSQRDSTLNSFEGIARYRGFGWQVTPHAGVVLDRRNVNDRTESYHERGAFVGVEYIPITPVWLAVNLRSVYRDFDSSVAHGDHENHDFLEAMADVHAMRRVHFMLYYEREHVASPLAGQSFNTQVLILGTAWSL